MSADGSLKFLFRLAAMVHFNFTLYYDWFYIAPPHETQPNTVVPWFRPYKLKYLTFWDVVLQTVFFTICVLGDLFAKEDHDHILRRMQNRIMVALAYPLAMFVGITFWSIYLFDRELILPKSMDAFFPVWLNHCMHTNIVVFMLIEFVTTRYNYQPRTMNITILLSVMVAYLVWVFVIYAGTGVWVYPILAVLPWPLKITFFIGCLALALALYFSGERLNASLHPKQHKKSVTLTGHTIADETQRHSPPDVTTTAARRSSLSDVKKEKKKKPN